MTDSTTDNRPSLLQDPSFWGLNLTQFLGAFNDNLYKQLVMVRCLKEVADGRTDLQGLALILFAAPFIAFSGYAGFLSDRFSKRSIIVMCKVAEIIIVLLGMIGFFMDSLPSLLAVLCLMGMHSTFFGPPKYGILPEMLRTTDLPRANGMMLMATFLAIIFGLSAAGAAMHMFPETLWLASLPCIAIAMTGLVSSLAIRPTPVAQPDLQFDFSSVAIAPETQRLLRANHTMLGVLMMSSVFWFIGGTIYPPVINAVCQEQFHLNKLYSGLLAASTGVGIAIGCVAAGFLCKDRVRGWIVKMGAWGITLSLLILAIPGPGWDAAREDIQIAKEQFKSKSNSNNSNRMPVDRVDSEPRKTEGSDLNDLIHEPPSEIESQQLTRKFVANETYRGTMLGQFGTALGLISVGVFAGFYSVPLSVYLQSTAPTEQKGRIIGANNLMNWIGIAGAGGVYWIGRILFVDWLILPPATLFGFASLLMLPVALFYRPPEAEVKN